MPEWLSPVLIFAGVVIGVAGSLIGHRVVAKKNEGDLQQTLLDQVQEERNWQAQQLKEQREYHDKKMDELQERHDKAVRDLNVRITGFYVDKSASRRYISSLQAREAELVAHILLGNPPPPPGASPEPPDGYQP